MHTESRPWWYVWMMSYHTILFKSATTCLCGENLLLQWLTSRLFIKSYLLFTFGEKEYRRDSHRLGGGCDEPDPGSRCLSFGRFVGWWLLLCGLKAETSQSDCRHSVEQATIVCVVMCIDSCWLLLQWGWFHASTNGVAVVVKLAALTSISV